MISVRLKHDIHHILKYYLTIKLRRGYSFEEIDYFAETVISLQSFSFR